MAAEAQERGGPLEASSYRPLYRIQHVIYKIGDIKLPFPVGFDALALFFLYLTPLALLAKLAPWAFSLFGLPAFVTIPAAAALLAHASAKLEPAGKGILGYLGGLAAHALRARWWVRGAPAPRVPRAASGRRHKVVLGRLAARLRQQPTASLRREGEEKELPRPTPAHGVPALWGRPAPAAAGTASTQAPEPREPEAAPEAGGGEPPGEPEPAPVLWAAFPAPQRGESPLPGEPEPAPTLWAEAARPEEAAESGEPPALWPGTARPEGPAGGAPPALRGGPAEEPDAAAPPEAAPARPKRQARGRPARRAPKRGRR